MTRRGPMRSPDGRGWIVGPTRNGSTVKRTGTALGIGVSGGAPCRGRSSHRILASSSAAALLATATVFGKSRMPLSFRYEVATRPRRRLPASSLTASFDAKTPRPTSPSTHELRGSTFSATMALVMIRQ